MGAEDHADSRICPRLICKMLAGLSDCTALYGKWAQLGDMHGSNLFDNEQEAERLFCTARKVFANGRGSGVTSYPELRYVETKHFSC